MLGVSEGRSVGALLELVLQRLRAVGCVSLSSASFLDVLQVMAHDAGSAPASRHSRR